MKNKFTAVRIHPTAVIEKGVRIGGHSSVWDNVHIRKNTTLGRHVTVGEKTYIAYNVRIGNFVKINAFVYIPTGVTIEDKVMVSAGCIFVNDKYPRAFDFKKQTLLDAGPNEETLKTVVREGATLGAAAVILGGLEIGRHSLVGAGSVVTRSVKPHTLVAGNPARPMGWVCRCGAKLTFRKKRSACRCGEKYGLKKNGVFSIPR